MADRYCPHCGELVPSTSVTCPKCYRRIPAEPVVDTGRTRDGSGGTGSRDTGARRQGYDRRLALLLDLIPGFFGFLGIGQIYRDHRSSKGYLMLLSGLAIFALTMMLLLNITPGVLSFLAKVSAFPLMLLYALMYIGAAVDILIDVVFSRVDIRR
ncbi:MAG: hypothetical protein IJ026_02045 [Candidatus Methanomethylophilaceae archaeon]|nr:hypothetical protein [Candidatus Methanomethylophilaceae archaeon]